MSKAKAAQRKGKSGGPPRLAGGRSRRTTGAAATGAPTVGLLCEAMERIAPTWTAEDWDNVGLLGGGADWPARRILLTVDLTAAVLAEARQSRADVILSYHPPIFRPIKNMTTDGTGAAALAADAVASRIAVYSPHTALDAAPGGANDTLAALCGLVDAVPVRPAAAAERQCKLVVFVPSVAMDNVAAAVFEAGAGRIGDYEQCSFRLRGEGTFFGTDATQPVVGQKGRLERVEEIRLEVVLPTSRLADVAAAVRRSHPYEEPAFDVYPLEPVPAGGIGQGRIGWFRRPVALLDLARQLARRTGAKNVVILDLLGGAVRPRGRGTQLVRTAGIPANRRRPDSAAGGGPRGQGRLARGVVWVGAAGSSPLDLPPGRQLGPGDVVITGEIRHHDALRYQRCGVAAVALGHWASERPVLKPLADRLVGVMPGIVTIVSQADCDPFCHA